MSKQNNSLKDSIQKLINNGVVKLTDSFEKSVDNIVNNVSEIAEESSLEEIADMLIRLWNLREINVPIITFEYCVEIVKSNFDKSRYSGACIYNKGLNSNNKIELYICYLDKNNEPLLDGSITNWIIYAESLDDILMNQFGDKNMIVLK